jgi:branched-chain amino acid transport system substrate-binding protein
MKEKVITTTVLTMILIGTLLIIAPTLGVPDPIKIGIIGPVGLPHWSPCGMKEGAEIAAQQINDAGGVNVGGTYRNITLVEGNENSYPGIDIDEAQAEVVRLYNEGCRIMIGGFRTEVTGPMIEMAMGQVFPYLEEPVIFLINGASTNELIMDRLHPITGDYETYKYLFRVNPTNSTVLLMTVAGSIQTLITKMLPIYGCPNMGPYENITQVKVAVLTEALDWTLVIHEYLTNSSIYPGLLGSYANVTYHDRIPYDQVDVSSWIGNVAASGARILIHIFSAPVGGTVIGTWRALNVKAVPVGINVVAQLQTYWSTLGGACEYESTLNFVGTDTPISPEAEQFWDDFDAHTGNLGIWPIYTAYGAYNAVNLAKEAIEAAGTTDADTVVSALEAIDTTSLTGRFKFSTSPIPHDVFCNSVGPFWVSPQYTRALMVQWQAARMEVVCPMYADYPPTTLLSYAKDWAFPPWMYPNQTDVNYDGKVRVDDVLAASMAFGSDPGHDRWQRRIDVTNDYKIRVDDILAIALDFGNTFEQYFPLYCDG